MPGGSRRMLGEAPASLRNQNLLSHLAFAWRSSWTKYSMRLVISSWVSSSSNPVTIFQRLWLAASLRHPSFKVITLWSSLMQPFARTTGRPSSLGCRLQWRFSAFCLWCSTLWLESSFWSHLSGWIGMTYSLFAFVLPSSWLHRSLCLKHLS